MSSCLSVVQIVTVDLVAFVMMAVVNSRAVVLMQSATTPKSVKMVFVCRSLVVVMTTNVHPHSFVSICAVCPKHLIAVMILIVHLAKFALMATVSQIQCVKTTQIVDLERCVVRVSVCLPQAVAMILIVVPQKYASMVHVSS